MALFTMTYGTLPTDEQFEAAWRAEIAKAEPLDWKFALVNDKRVGTCALTQAELWREIQSAHQDYHEHGDEEAGDWCSRVLECFSIEWV